MAIEIVRPEHMIEFWYHKGHCDVDEFVRMLLSPENLKEFQLVTPFYQKLSDADGR